VVKSCWTSRSVRSLATAISARRASISRGEFRVQDLWLPVGVPPIDFCNPWGFYCHCPTISYIYSGCNLHSFQELQLWDIKSQKTNMLTFPSKNICQSYYLLSLELGRKYRWNICGSQTFPKYIIYKCNMSKYNLYRHSYIYCIAVFHLP
jgi:hypothetical protein